MKLPWKTKGIILTAPLTGEVDNTVKFIDEYLAPNGCNLIVMQIRYRYKFQLHPECRGYDPLSKEDVKKIVEVCRKNNIRLVPKMNLIGHQSGLPNTPTDGILHGHHERIPDIRDGLLRAYPEFDEEPDKPAFYSRSLCLTNPLVKIIVFDLIDELLDVFESNGLHIGCDEAIGIGKCPECAKVPPAKLFGDWVTAIHDHIAQRGAQLMIWGDGFLNAEETGYIGFGASNTFSDTAINTVPKDIIMCDWHYDFFDTYPSVNIFALKGFKMMICPWFNNKKASAFINYAKQYDEGHIEGLLMTTWCGSGDLSRHMLYGEPGRWHATEQIAETIRFLFEE